MPNGPAKPKYTVKPSREKFSFDVEGAILFFGGFVSFQNQLLNNGMDAPTYNNFRGWRTRRTMSADLIARMIRLARILNVPFDLHDYIVDPISMTKKLPPAAVQPEQVSPAAPVQNPVDPVAPIHPVNQRAMRRGY